MLESIPVTALAIVSGYGALNAYRKNDTAFSDEAKCSVSRAVSVLDAAEMSQALFGAKERAISSLKTLAKECSKDNWDGDGAEAVDYFALLNAEDFVRALPARMRMPEFAVDPDGSISLDWIVTRYQVFSISIGPRDRISFAWVSGTDSGHGVAHFDGVSVPNQLLVNLRSIIGNDGPSLWLD
jgi:hypothetical protein